MNVGDAASLLGSAVNSGERWADLGAGTGTFTAALARLVGATGAVIAIERDASRVRALEQLARHLAQSTGTRVDARRGDFTTTLDLFGMDGLLVANALHYVPAPDQANTLKKLAGYAKRDGWLVVVEYDDRSPSRWVPYPISRPRLAVLARQAAIGAPEPLGERRSTFGGTMYAARLRASI